MKIDTNDTGPLKKTYLADRVAELLKARLLSGEYPGRLPGERVLAESLKVSRRVVRGALAILDAEGFSAKPAAGMSRRPVSSTAGGGATRSRRIGLLTALPMAEADPTVLAMFNRLRELAEESGRACVFIECDEARPAMAEATALRLIERYDCDLWIGVALRSAGVVDALHAKGCSVIGYNFSGAKPYATIGPDLDSARLHAVNTLLRKGRRRVVVPLAFIPAPEWAESMRRLFESRGLPYDPAFNRPIYTGGRTGFCELMTRLFSGDDAPDGVVMGHPAEVSLVTLVGVLQSKRLRCPEDVSVLGVLSPPYREHMVPVPGVYVENDRQLLNRLMRAVRDFMRTGRVPTGRQLVTMDYLPGDSV